MTQLLRQYKVALRSNSCEVHPVFTSLGLHALLFRRQRLVSRAKQDDWIPLFDEALPVICKRLGKLWIRKALPYLLIEVRC